MRSFACLLLLASLCLTLAQIGVYANQLPARVASHFGAGGVADGWMSRGSFLALYVGLQLGLAAVMLVLAWSLSRLPVSLINIPHREYWLDETRRDETIRVNQSILLLLAGITALFLVVMFQLTILANLRPDARLNGAVTGGSLAVYLTMVLGICGWLVWRFSRIPDAWQAPDGSQRG